MMIADQIRGKLEGEEVYIEDEYRVKECLTELTESSLGELSFTISLNFNLHSTANPTLACSL